MEKKGDEWNMEGEEEEEENIGVGGGEISERSVRKRKEGIN